MEPGDYAESLIAELGISAPEDLDVEAIAFDASLEVEYEPLNGCEASLVGFGDRGIATIRPSSSRGRERFSIAHELGHWLLHRGSSFRCRVDDPDLNLVANQPRERQADDFASHLLLPSSMFNPLVKRGGKTGFRELEDIAHTFDTSLLATALRLVKVDSLPVILACYSRNGLRWHLAARHIPRRWWLKRKLDEDTFAFDLMTKGSPCPTPRKQSADAWFDNDDADEFEVLEQCVFTTNRDVLVLLFLTDTEMFDRGFDPNVGSRRYNELGSYIPRNRKR